MITVLVAAYNGEAYIREQMDSILAQSQGGIHIVVSDDCSTDSTPEILDCYQRQHPGRVTVIRRSRPSGGAAAHFLGLLSALAGMDPASMDLEGIDTEARRRAPGEAAAAGREIGSEDSDGFGNAVKAGLPVAAAQAGYFMLSDQDDVWLPQKAEKLLMCMQELEAGLKPGTPALVHSDLAVVDENLRVLAHSFFKYQKISPQRTALPQLLVQNNVTGGAVMINRAMVELLAKLPRICLMHDAWLALLASCFGAIGWVDEPLYLYRQHRSNTLGAEKGDNLKGVRDRLEDGSGASENYRKMFGQARCLLELFPERLTGEQKEILNAFVRIPELGRIQKIRTIIKYGFTKNTWLRTLGQMLMIG